MPVLYRETVIDQPTSGGGQHSLLQPQLSTGAASSYTTGRTTMASPSDASTCIFGAADPRGGTRSEADDGSGVSFGTWLGAAHLGPTTRTPSDAATKGGEAASGTPFPFEVRAPSSGKHAVAPGFSARQPQPRDEDEVTTMRSERWSREEYFPGEQQQQNGMGASARMPATPYHKVTKEDYVIEQVVETTPKGLQTVTTTRTRTVHQPQQIMQPPVKGQPQQPQRGQPLQPAVVPRVTKEQESPGQAAPRPKQPQQQQYQDAVSKQYSYAYTKQQPQPTRVPLKPATTQPQQVQAVQQPPSSQSPYLLQPQAPHQLPQQPQNQLYAQQHQYVQQQAQPQHMQQQQAPPQLAQQQEQLQYAAHQQSVQQLPFVTQHQVRQPQQQQTQHPQRVQQPAQTQKEGQQLQQRQQYQNVQKVDAGKGQFVQPAQAVSKEQQQKPEQQRQYGRYVQQEPEQKGQQVQAVQQQQQFKHQYQPYVQQQQDQQHQYESWASYEQFQQEQQLFQQQQKTEDTVPSEQEQKKRTTVVQQQQQRSSVKAEGEGEEEGEADEPPPEMQLAQAPEELLMNREAGGGGGVSPERRRQHIMVNSPWYRQHPDFQQQQPQQPQQYQDFRNYAEPLYIYSGSPDDGCYGSRQQSPHKYYYQHFQPQQRVHHYFSPSSVKWDSVYEDEYPEGYPLPFAHGPGSPYDYLLYHQKVNLDRRRAESEQRRKHHSPVPGAAEHGYAFGGMDFVNHDGFDPFGDVGEPFDERQSRRDLHTGPPRRRGDFYGLDYTTMLGSSPEALQREVGGEDALYYHGYQPLPPRKNFRLCGRYTADPDAPLNIAEAQGLDELDSEYLVGNTLSNQKCMQDRNLSDEEKRTFALLYGPGGFKPDHVTIRPEPKPDAPPVFSTTIGPQKARSVDGDSGSPPHGDGYVNPMKVEGESWMLGRRSEQGNYGLASTGEQPPFVRPARFPAHVPQWAKQRQFTMTRGAKSVDRNLFAPSWAKVPQPQPPYWVKRDEAVQQQKLSEEQHGEGDERLLQQQQFQQLQVVQEGQQRTLQQQSPPQQRQPNLQKQYPQKQQMQQEVEAVQREQKGQQVLQKEQQLVPGMQQQHQLQQEQQSRPMQQSQPKDQQQQQQARTTVSTATTQNYQQKNLAQQQSQTAQLQQTSSAQSATKQQYIVQQQAQPQQQDDHLEQQQAQQTSRNLITKGTTSRPTKQWQPQGQQKQPQQQVRAVQQHYEKMPAQQHPFSQPGGMYFFQEGPRGTVGQNPQQKMEIRQSAERQTVQQQSQRTSDIGTSGLENLKVPKLGQLPALPDDGSTSTADDGKQLNQPGEEQIIRNRSALQNQLRQQQLKQQQPQQQQIAAQQPPQQQQPRAVQPMQQPPQQQQARAIQRAQQTPQQQQPRAVQPAQQPPQKQQIRDMYPAQQQQPSQKQQVRAVQPSQQQQQSPLRAPTGRRWSHEPQEGDIFLDAHGRPVQYVRDVQVDPRTGETTTHEEWRVMEGEGEEEEQENGQPHSQQQTTTVTTKTRSSSTKR